MITMRDIAKRAGVSRSTVSFVLNDKHTVMGVNENTRRRVLAVADELGYRRNELARAMVTGKNSTLAFLVWGHMLGHEPTVRVLGGVLDEAEAHQHIVHVLRLAEHNDEEIIRRCIELRPAGVVSVSIEQGRVTHLKQEVTRFHIPIVVLDSSPPLAGESRIVSDDIQGCRQAIDHLTSLGHRRIAFIGGSRETVISQLRDQGYQEAMSAVGLPILPGYQENGCWNPEVIDRVTRRLLLDCTPPPTAIFCVEDRTAMVVCRTLSELGVRVPHDVSVVGFADLSSRLN